MKTVNRNYKDSLFRDIFNNEERLAEIYTGLLNDPISPHDIQLTTLDWTFFTGIRNDVSFIVKEKHIVLLEHQSTCNENMPLRLLMYMCGERLSGGLFQTKAKRGGIRYDEFCMESRACIGNSCGRSYAAGHGERDGERDGRDAADDSAGISSPSQEYAAGGDFGENGLRYRVSAATESCDAVITPFFVGKNIIEKYFHICYTESVGICPTLFFPLADEGGDVYGVQDRA